MPRRREPKRTSPTTAAKKKAAVVPAVASELVILTGLSGSGKASALKAFEDLGFYAVDNMPLELIPAFADLVKASFARMAGEGTLSRLYNRWLVDRLPNGEKLDLPMSAQLAEMYRVLGQPD